MENNKLGFAHQRKKKAPNSPSLPMVSCGDSELQLLRYIYNNQNVRFNLRNYSEKIVKIPRSTIKSRIIKLITLGLLEKPNPAITIITSKGIKVVEGAKTGGENLRRDGRKEEQKILGDLNTHNLKYKLKIDDKRFFSENRIKELSPVRQKFLGLKNLEQHYIYFEDATIVVNPKQIIIHIKDIISEDTETAHLEAFEKAMSYAEKLEKIGLKTSEISLEPSHYARVNSLLADSLEKIDNRYFLDLGNGKKFWIDNSTGPKEDETNSEEARDRLDTALKTIMNTEIDLLDINRMKEVLGLITKIHIAEIGKSKIEPKEIVPEGRPDYFG